MLIAKRLLQRFQKCLRSDVALSVELKVSLRRDHLRRRFFAHDASCDHLAVVLADHWKDDICSSCARHTVDLKNIFIFENEILLFALSDRQTGTSGWIRYLEP